MSVSAWVMFVIGALLLWGGLAASIYNAVKARNKTDRSQDFADPS
ncbi:MetS family NSS transporter small subunit [Novibacillus thermophilus]|jgi:hypothetical protein|nr:MetS family NSS transporter small subunit [Novibacillus thermophilus]